MRGKEITLNIPYMEIVDKHTHNKIKLKNVNFRLLRELDLKFDFGIFKPNKRYFDENGNEVKEK